MPIDTSSFATIQKTGENFKSQAIKDNVEIIEQVKEVIRYQYELHEKAADYLNNKYPSYDSQSSSITDKRIAISHSLYTQNFRAIHSSYELVLSGKIAASRVLVRKIYESILAQYYVGLCTDDEMSEFAQDTEKEDTRSKFNHNFFKQKLFQDDQFDQMSKVYSMLSDVSHPNWKTFFDLEYNKEMVKDAFLNLRTFSLFNVLSYCEMYNFDHDFLQILVDFVQPFVDQHLFNSNYQLDDIFPNREPFAGKLIWSANKQNKTI